MAFMAADSSTEALPSPPSSRHWVSGSGWAAEPGTRGSVRSHPTWSPHEAGPPGSLGTETGGPNEQTEAGGDGHTRQVR